MTTGKLPLDIWILVVDSVLQCTLPKASILPRKAIKTLASLCLVSKEIYDLARAQLYRRPLITPRNLANFSRTIHSWDIRRNVSVDHSLELL